ncbi:MAG: MFS transporter [Chromatiales bacterium]|nr:MFS transporter [Chromatiales bacterium]
MPYWRLSGFYLAYFAALGALVPYWPLYLEGRGFGAAEIGELIAVLMATKLLAPFLWSWLADRTGLRMPVVRSGSLLAVLSFTLVLFEPGFWPLALVTALFSFFWNAALPQFEAVTLNHLRHDTHQYPRVRLWGSVGFVVTVVACGPLLDRFGTGWLPAVLLACFVLIWGVSHLVADAPGVGQAGHPPRGGTLVKIMRAPPVAAFFVVCFLAQFGHGPYYAFFSVHLEASGYSRTLIGQLWALGVIAEIALFIVMPRLAGRLNLRRMLVLALAIAAVRWLAIGLFADRLWVVLLAQLGHAATFGLFHAGAIELVHRYFHGRHQGRGQALYSSLSFGAGGAAGSLSAGYLWSAGAQWAFGVAAGAAALGALVAWLWLRGPEAERPARIEAPEAPV